MPIHKLGFVGAKFRPRGLEVLGQLEDKHPVLLVREPTNPIDPNAIAVYVQIGYIPAAQAATWASQFDTLVPRMSHAGTLLLRKTIELITPSRPMATYEDHPPTEDDIPF